MNPYFEWPCEHLLLLFSYAAHMSRYDRPSHRVYMSFFFRGAWQVQFLEADLKTPLPRTFTFTDPEKIRELARRGEGSGDSESRQMLEHAIETGRGGGLPSVDAGAVSSAEARARLSGGN